MPEHFATVRRLFDTAVEMPKAERDTWLATQAATKETIAEVRSLLDADDNRTSRPILDKQALPDLGSFSSVTQPAGRRIGNFVLLRVLGSGGMGTVYEATQDRPQRSVALKMLRQGFSNERSRRRFEFEAEVLGRLRHPGIAQVLEAGTFEEDEQRHPYFAMEYVAGARPLDSYVSESKPSRGTVLALFTKICEAVHYGHQRGVIHRDLKPANILIDEDGNPKIIDFGIARVTDHNETEEALLTETGQILGTLQFMSPEQLTPGQDNIDTRVDVYALGIVLYHLITGRAPFDINRTALGTAADIICNQTPPRPSVITRESSAYDLDWIVLKAIEKDPANRYPSASELAQDIARFQANQPVVAGPPSASYRARKFVARNRTLVIASAICLVTIISSAVSATVGWNRAVRAETIAKEDKRRAERAEAIARTNREKAEAEALTQQETNRLMRQILAGAHHTGKGKDVRLVELLESASHRLENFHSTKPETELSLHNALASSYLTIEELEAAERELETALAIIEAQFPNPTRTTLAVTTNYAVLALKRGEHSKAEAWLTKGKTGRIELLGAQSPEVAESNLILATLYNQREEFELAAASARAAMESFELAGTDFTLEAIRSRSALAQTLYDGGKTKLAIPLIRRAAERARQEIGERHSVTLLVLNNYVTIMRGTAEPDELIKVMSQVLEICNHNFGEGHPKSLRALNNLASVLQDKGRLADAIATYRKIVTIHESSPDRGRATGLIARNNLAVVLQRKGEFAESRQVFEALLVDCTGRIPTGHWLLAVFHKGYGVCLGRLGEHAAAEKELLGALAILEPKFGDKDRRVIKARAALAVVRTAMQSSASEEPSERKDD